MKKKNEVKILEKCRICPRQCGVERKERKGFCNENETLSIAKVIKHFTWEEPCLSDQRGVLAIFFSGCNLRCDYCQNYAISRGGVGKNYTLDEFVELIEQKQKEHCAIDLITPTHFSNMLTKAFEKIKKSVPVIWNTNSYETIENIKKVSKFVDIFLPDFKYSSNQLGSEFSSCQNYHTFALPAIKEMCRQKKDQFKKNDQNQDILTQGVVIRHLVLPGHVKNSIKVLDEIKQNFPDRIVSVMSQFTPNGKSKLDRKITPIEYKTVLAHLEKIGLNKGYIQEFSSASDCFVPDF